MRRSWPTTFSPPGRIALSLAVCGCLAASAAGEPSGPTPSEATPESWFEAHGISVGLVSKADVLSRVRGGLSSSHAPRYRGHLDLVATLDTEKLGLWSGGTVVLVAQNGHGRGVSEGDVGDLQALSNIDAHSFTQMSEWYLEQTFMEKRLRVKVGRQDAAVDFGLVEFGAEFLNSSFGVIPTNPLPTFPDPALGLSAFANVTDEVSLGAGVYSATPVEWGLLRGTTFGIEVGYAPRSSNGEAATKYRAGFWYQEDPFESEAPGASSVYAAIDQALFREGDGEQGLNAFLQVGTSSGAPNGVSDYVGAGVLYTGLLPGRDEDRLGLGVAHARLPAWAARGTAETAIELLYRVSPWRWLTLQPSVHWVLRPGGQGQAAVVAGLRIETEF